MTDTPVPAPGWYPDPSGSAGLRWWDGERWTDDTHALTGEAVTSAPAGSVITAPAPVAPPAAEPAARRQDQPRAKAVALVAAFLVIAILAVAVLVVGLGRTRLTTADVEAQIADAIANELGLATTVTCPDVVDAGKGLSFTCDVKVSDGKTATVKVTQNDDAGNVTWDVVPAQ